MGSLGDIACESDIVTVHVPLNPDTTGLIGDSFFKQCKEDVSIINTSRGRVLSEEALVAFLEENSKAFAYLDVFYTEPPDKKLLDLINLRITPHCAFFSEDSFHELKSSIIYDSVVAFMRDDFVKRV